MQKYLLKFKRYWNTIKLELKRSTFTEKMVYSCVIFYATMMVTIVVLLFVVLLSQAKVNEALLGRTEMLINMVAEEQPESKSLKVDSIEEIPQAEPLVTIEEPEEEEVYIPEVSEEEIELIARITWCEAGAECEEGKRLVIDTILNRVDSDHFPDSIEGVIFQPNQFSPVSNGAFDKAEVREDIYQLVLEELESRTDDDVVFFRAGRYHKWGTPLFQVGNHYFSSYD